MYYPPLRLVRECSATFEQQRHEYAELSSAGRVCVCAWCVCGGDGGLCIRLIMHQEVRVFECLDYDESKMGVCKSVLRVLVHTWIGNTVAEAVLLLICASNGLAGCAVAVVVTSMSPAAPAKVVNDFRSVDAKTRAVGVTMSMGACPIGS